MNKLNPQDLTYILMPIFEDKKYLGAIINWGTQEGDIVTYTTNYGVQHTNINAFDSSFKLHKLSDLNFKDSLHYWTRNKKNNEHYNKPFVYDKDLTTGEIYTQYTWAVSVMIHPTDTEVKVKLILH